MCSAFCLSVCGDGWVFSPIPDLVCQLVKTISNALDCCSRLSIGMTQDQEYVNTAVRLGTDVAFHQLTSSQIEAQLHSVVRGPLIDQAADAWANLLLQLAARNGSEPTDLYTSKEYEASLASASSLLRCDPHAGTRVAQRDV